MATTDKEESVGEHAGQDIPVGGMIPTMRPPATDPWHLDSAGSTHVTFQPSHQSLKPPYSEEVDLKHAQNDPPATEEDQMKTPMLEHPPSVIESSASKLGEPVQNYNQQNYKGNGEEEIPGHADYFVHKVPQDSSIADMSRTSSSSNVSSTGFSGFMNNQLDTAPTPVSPSSRAGTWKDYVPSFNPEKDRPVSVPNLRSKPLSPRRDGPDYPRYPDQSFKALQDHHYYRRPVEPHHLRTRSSQPSQNQSYSSSDETITRAHSHNSSGAKTAGNTPAQSPGLFAPGLSQKHWTGESDETRSGSPLLHPAHLQMPKE